MECGLRIPRKSPKRIFQKTKVTKSPVTVAESSTRLLDKKKSNRKEIWILLQQKKKGYHNSFMNSSNLVEFLQDASVRLRFVHGFA